ncbi:MAG: hypothetical protein RLZZ74_245, partial [Cyanobacteriota bacterium]
ISDDPGVGQFPDLAFLTSSDDKTNIPDDCRNDVKVL